MKTQLIFTILMLVGSYFCFAQDSFSSAGGDVNGSGGSEAFSTGLVVYTELTGAGGSASQGIEYAYEIFPVSVTDTEEQIAISVFPNPSVDELTILFSELEGADLLYRLDNINGQQLIDGSISNTQTQINTAQLPVGIYVLTIFENNRFLRSFKIIKK